MAILDILHYPDPRLRTKAEPVAEVNAEIRQLIEDMTETMYEAEGIGLAATQVNVHKRVIVMDLTPDRSGLHVFVNPEITLREGEQISEEGCLSVPDYYDDVRRAGKVTVKALDKNGKAFILEAEGLLSVCIQHEIDHLNGVVFVDYLSRLKQQRITKKLIKQRRLAI